MNNNQNIFDINNKIQNINIQNQGNNYYNQQNFAINPIKAIFEKNRTLKDDKILYYAIATTEYKTKIPVENLPPILQEIVTNEDVYCLVGISRKRFHFQYYTNTGDLLYANVFTKDMIKDIRMSYIAKTTLIEIRVNKKESIYFYFADDLSETAKEFITFGDNDQTLIMKQIRDGLAKKELLI